MRTISINQYPEGHFPQVDALAEEKRPKNYVVINHNCDNDHQYTTKEIVAFARQNNAITTIDETEHFALLFGCSGNKPVLLKEFEIEKTIKDPLYGQ